MIILPNLGLATDFSNCQENALAYINRNFRILDSMVQLHAISFESARPDDPVEDGVYLLPTSVEIWTGTNWISIPAEDGFFGYVASEDGFYSYKTSEGGWSEFASGSGGGIMVVETIAERNAIEADNRYDGLLVYVKALADRDFYQLRDGILDSNWVGLKTVYVPVSTALSSIYGTLSDGSPVMLTYSNNGGANFIVQYTDRGQARGVTLEDTDPDATNSDYINREYFNLIRTDRWQTTAIVTPFTLSWPSNRDAITFTNSVAAFTLTLESNLFAIRRIVMKFTGDIQDFTINPGTHLPGPTANTIDWYPKAIKAGDCLSYQFNYVTYRWECTGFFSATSHTVKAATVTFTGAAATFLDVPRERIVGKGSTGGGTLVPFPNGTRDGQEKFFVGAHDTDTFIIAPTANIKCSGNIEHFLGSTSTWHWVESLSIWSLKSTGVV